MTYSIKDIADILHIPENEIISALQWDRQLSMDTDVALWCTDAPGKVRQVVLRYYASRLEQVSHFLPPEPPAIPDENHVLPSGEESGLERIVREKVIAMDTCTLMHEGCEKLIDKLIPLLSRYERVVYIPYCVLEELRQHMQHRWDRIRASAAAKGYEQCKKLQEAGCLSVRGSRLDSFADNVFFVLFSKYRYRSHMLLVTQDRKLTMDILQLNKTKASSGYPIEVMFIDRNGDLHGVNVIES